MSLIRTNSANSFKPIPEDSESHHDHTTASQNNNSHRPSPQTNGAPTPESQVEELRQLLQGLQETRTSRRGGGGGPGGTGSRPSSRCSVRSGSWSRLGSRRSSWTQESEDEDENHVPEVSSSQKASLLVASQQRLVYTLQDMRHELVSLDEEVNRIRNDILNSRRFFNAMRGIQGEATWGSSWRRFNGSGSSSPSLSTYSLENSFSTSDIETDSMVRSESCCSFTSWRSEAELLNVFNETEEEVTVGDRGDKGIVVGVKERALHSRPNSTGPRGRYRQLGTLNGRA